MLLSNHAFAGRALRLCLCLCRLGVYVGCLSSLGCTFITACPTGNGNPAGPAAGSGGSAGGGAGGGSGTSGGSTVVTPGNVPAGDWVDVTPDFSGIVVDCGPAAFLSSKPDEDMLIAGVKDNGLVASRDGGQSWQPLGSAASSDHITNIPSFIDYDPASSGTFWEVGPYGSAGLYKTTDDGVTLLQVDSLFHDDFVTVDFTDPMRQTLLVSGHEQQILHKSTDGGATWQDIEAAIPAGTKVCSFPFIVAQDNWLLGCGGKFDSGSPAILQSKDQGTSWTKVHDNAGAAAPLLASDGSIYWAQELDSGLARSTDNGGSWQQVADGTILSIPAIELPDGRIASATTQNVVLSSDGGATWKTASPSLPYSPQIVVYSRFQKAFFIWHFDCGASARPSPPNQIMRFDFDYQAY